MKSLRTYIQESRGNVNRLLDKHSKDGYVIISACRQSNSKTQNNINTAELEKTIADAGWSYSPCTGHYVEEKTGKPGKEKSFIIYCNKNGAPAKFNDLKKFAIEQCAQWNQDSVLVVRPDEIPAYYNKKGKKVTARWARFNRMPAIQRTDSPYQTQVGSSKFSFKRAEQKHGR